VQPPLGDENSVAWRERTCWWGERSIFGGYVTRAGSIYVSLDMMRCSMTHTANHFHLGDVGRRVGSLCSGACRRRAQRATRVCPATSAAHGAWRRRPRIQSRTDSEPQDRKGRKSARVRSQEGSEVRKGQQGQDTQLELQGLTCSISTNFFSPERWSSMPCRSSEWSGVRMPAAVTNTAESVLLTRKRPSSPLGIRLGLKHGSMSRRV
jgi:hypothetical protein